jgi:hypothetical protein
LQPFEPFFRNPHLATLAGNFWKRPEAGASEPVIWETEPGVRVMAMTATQAGAIGDAILLHGLEGSHDSGYLRSLAPVLFAAGFNVHRLNMRGCGGTEGLSKTLYHSGLTADLRVLVERLKGPIAIAGFSLGGNATLKFAGEMGEAIRGKVRAVAAVSVPLDLGACCRRMEAPDNWIYHQRFVRSLKARFLRRCAEHPDLYQPDGVDRIRSVWEFDDRITARYFGFGTAENYYRTQSAQAFLGGIGVPALVIHAIDDPLIPWAVYERQEAFRTNPYLQLRAVDHGGHVGFIARRTPRFWVDGVIRDHFLRNFAGTKG